MADHNDLRERLGSTIPPVPTQDAQMQLLIQTSAPDYAAWKSAFDAQAETMAHAGLSTLQIWKGDGGAVLVLFQVAQRERADGWLARESALGRGVTAQFLETA